MPTPPDPSIAVNLAGLPLRSPVLAAAGTAGVLDELADVLDLTHLGAIVTKSITRSPREGNSFPRITWARAGMLNAIGLANPGLDAWLSNIAPRIAGVPTNVFCSVAGDSIEDYAAIAKAMDETKSVPMIELNVSCPNVHSGLEFGADPAALGELVAAVRMVVNHAKLFVKLSPITVGTPNSLVDLARVAVDAGADGLTLCNTVPAMGIDVHTRKPILSNTTGGLSGPAIHPIIVRLVHLVYTQFAKDAGVEIIAAGGVTRWEDAAEFILAGANAVQIGAGLFADPRLPIKINKGLAKWVAKQGKSNISDFVGAVDLSDLTS
ncbi:MAG: dihydroorotate dehydrogenase [Phycisphaerales bacterium]|nr:dihydroorotate dehydrogenase [Phycisphaerales bacterium]